MIRPKIKPQFRPPLPGPKPPAPPGLLSNIPRPGMKPPVPGLLTIAPPSVLEQIKEGALLSAPVVTPEVSTQSVEDDSAFIAAMHVGKDKGVPANWIIENIIKPIAQHESNDDPLKRQDVYVTGDELGIGRGVMQFEGEYGQLGADKKPMGFETSVGRSIRYLTNKKLPVPQWLTDIKEGDDARSLTKNQQYALAIYDFRMKKGADISKVYTGKQTLSNFWENSHWAGPGRSGNPNASEEDKAIAKDRTESFARSMADHPITNPNNETNR